MQAAATPVAPVNPGAASSPAKEASLRADSAPEAEEQSFSSVLESRVVAQDASSGPSAGSETPAAEQVDGDAAQIVPDTPHEAAPDAASLLASLGLGTVAATLLTPAGPGALQAGGGAFAGAGAQILAPGVQANMAPQDAVSGKTALAPAAALLQTPVPIPGDAGAAKADDAASLAATGKHAVLPDAEPELLASTHDQAGVIARDGKEFPLTELRAGPGEPSVPGALLATAGAGPSAATARGPEMTSVTVAARLGSPEWDGQFAQRVALLAREHVQTAEVRINPPDLGPVEITLTLSESQATLAFTSQHAPVREAIESALPRLRELLAGAGITLGQATVGDQYSGREAQGQPGREAATSGNGGRRGGYGGEQLQAAPVRSHRVGMLDTFA